MIFAVFKPLYNDLLDQSLSDHAYNALWVIYIIWIFANFQDWKIIKLYCEHS